jgi:CRISPR-associated protein Csd1
MSAAAPAVAAGPLPALIAYYQRLEKSPQGVPPFGFSSEKIHFEVVLERSGALAAAGLCDLRKPNARGKPIHESMIVPDRGGRSGTKIKPFFCWDNTGYALGRDSKDDPERAAKMFAAFRDLHLSMKKEVGGDPGFAALCKFLEKWDPAQAEALPNWEEAAGQNVVFRLRGQEGYVHQSNPVKAAWLRRVEREFAAEVTRGVSLTSGEEDDIARLHPLLTGVAGANTTGAAIVSFNEDAYESYGKEQSFNSPVAVRDADRYTKALSSLLADDSRKVRIGDATVVFWTDRAEAAEIEDIARSFFAEAAPEKNADGKPAEDSITVARLHSFLNSARQGRLGDTPADSGAPFYVLGLSPNASRLNVRFWMAGTVGQFRDRLRRHVGDLEMTGVREGDPPLMIRRLLLETAREPKDIPPNLAGEVARAVLGGLPYPRSLFSAVLRRIRADATVNHRRAAILKAFLIRNQQQEVPVALDKDHKDEAYHLGRLFAVLEKTQEDSSGGKLNSTIKDRYFSSASATPGSVFPRLLRLHQHHMRSLDNPGMRVMREKLMGEVFGRIQRFPSHLAMEGQGLFDIGYYHQRQDLFTKKSDRATQDATNPETDHEQD